MKKRILMLIAFAGSAKTLLEYARCDGEGNILVPRDWLDSLAEMADKAIEEYETD